MTQTIPYPDIHEAVGIFFDSHGLERCIQDLRSAGFTRDEIGMLAGRTTILDKLSHIYEQVNAANASPDAPDVAFVTRESKGDTIHMMAGSLSMLGAAVTGGAVVASAGILGGALAAAVATGAVFSGIGALLAHIIHQSDADYLEEQIEEGHLLLFVRVHTPVEEKVALDILKRDAAFDPKVYQVKS